MGGRGRVVSVLGCGRDTIAFGTLAQLPVELALRDVPAIPIYQSMAPEAARMHDRRVTLKAIAQHFGVDRFTAAKALRWFRQL